jgi:hypothetical protein
MKSILAPAIVILATGFGQAAAESPPPDWYLEEIELLTSGSGRWEADNVAYKSDEEQFDAYVTEWRSSFDGLTMTGRLFGMTGGKESVTFWEFRHYWHPVQQKVVIEQFGWGGVIGVGTMWREEAATVSDQEFSAPDGRQWRAGHRSYFPDDATHVTDSYDIADGLWTKRRSYTWKKVTPQETGE